jgi:hypothetical protein
VASSVSRGSQHGTLEISTGAPAGKLCRVPMKRYGNRASARRLRQSPMRLAGRKSASASKSAAQTQRISLGQSQSALSRPSDPEEPPGRRLQACLERAWARGCLWAAYVWPWSVGIPKGFAQGVVRGASNEQHSHRNERTGDQQEPRQPRCADLRQSHPDSECGRHSQAQRHYQEKPF